MQHPDLFTGASPIRLAHGSPLRGKPHGRTCKARMCRDCGRSIQAAYHGVLSCRPCMLARRRVEREAAAAAQGRELPVGKGGHWRGRAVETEASRERKLEQLAELNAQQAWRWWLEVKAPQWWLEAAFRAEPWKRPRLTDAERWQRRYRGDPRYNLHEKLRVWRRKLAKGRTGEQVRRALRGKGSGRALFELLGYSIEDLRLHIERQFTRNMSWRVFFTGRIHIDHIIPLSAFDLDDPDGFRAAWALTNLRPLWAGDNIRKAAARVLLV